MRGRCLPLLRCLGLLMGLLGLLAGCGNNSGSSNTSGTVSRGRPLALQFQFSPQLASQAASASRRQGLASVQTRQVQPGEPGFIERLEIRLQAQGRDLVPLQVFTLDATEQETVTRDVMVPDTAPATFQVLVSVFTSQGIEVFRGDASVALGQTSAVVTLIRSALVPVPATPANLQQTTFFFTDGAIFDLANIPVTLATGTFVGNVGNFALAAHGLVASGSLTIGSCTLVVTTSAFPVGQGLQVGDQLVVDPCQIDAIDRRLIATNASVSATPTVSSPPVVAPPDSALNLPTSPPLVIDEDTSGALQIASDVSGTRPGIITLGITVPPAHGTATLTNAGVVTYQPAAHFNGSDRLVVTVVVSFTDNNSPGLLLGTVPILITVRPVNDAPVLMSPGDQTSQGGATVALRIVASDVDGNTLSFSAANLPPGLSLNATTGIINGTIADGAATGSPYGVTVMVKNSLVSSSVAFSWFITQVNRPPTLGNPGAQTTPEGTAVGLGLQANDPDGNALTFSATNLPPGLKLNTATGLISGTVDFTAAARGPYSVTVGVSDGPASVSTTFPWTITDINQPPTLGNPGTQTTPEGTAVGLGLQANDPDGNALTFSATNLPPGLTVNAATGVISGTVDFTAAAGSPYSVTVSASDGQASVSTAFVWTIANINQPPLLTNPGPQTTPEGTAVGLGLQANDPDSNALTFSATNLPPGLTVNAATGVISGTVDFTAAAQSPYSVALSASDGATSTSTTFTWAITDINQPPLLTNPGPQTTPEGTAVALGLQANDPDGNALTFSATNLPPGLTVNAATGVISGTVDFTAAAGSPYSVAVSASDGPASVSTVFTWAITDVNQPPTLSNPGAQTTLEGTAVTLGLQANDPDGNALTFSVTNLPPGLSFNTATGVISGTVDFTAAAGSPYSVTATVSDGTTSTSTTFTWAITDINQPPTLGNPGAQTTPEGTVVALGLQANDPDGNALTFSATNLPPGLSVNATSGVVSGTVDFTAAAGSPYSVTVAVSDGLASVSTVFAWTITDINRPPTLGNPGPQTTPEGTAVALGLQANDPDGNALTFSATNLPPGLSLAAATGLISGTVDFAAAAQSPYSVTATVSDGTASTSSTFAWTITNVNRPPTLGNPGPQTTPEGTAVALGLQANDPDSNALTFSATNLPPGLTVNAATGVISGTVDFTAAAGSPYSVTATVSDGPASVSTAFLWTITNVNRPPTLGNPGPQTTPEGTAVALGLQANDPDSNALTFSATNLPPGLTVNAATGVISGTVDFTAAAQSPYSVMVSASDGQASVSTVFAWTITDINQPPTLSNPGAQTTPEGTAVTLGLQGSDLDGNALTFSATNLPLGLTLNAATGVISGTVDFTAAAQSPYSVTVGVSDGPASVSTTFTWTITDINRPPILTDPGPQTTLEGTAVALGLQANDPDGNALTFSATNLPLGLIINTVTGVISGTVDFTAAAGSPYSITATVSDGTASTSSTFPWTITNVNQPPILTNPGDQTSTEGALVSLGLTASDPDSDPLTFSATNLPPGLTVNTVTGVISGTLTQTASAGSPYTVTVTVSDGALSTSVVFLWNVKAVRTVFSGPVGVSVVKVGTVGTLFMDATGSREISLRLLSAPAVADISVQASSADPQVADITPATFTLPRGAQDALFTVSTGNSNAETVITLHISTEVRTLLVVVGVPQVGREPLTLAAPVGVNIR